DLRKKKGLTLRQVGGRVGVSYSMISKVELGDCDPSITTLIKIAKALDVDLCRLFPDFPPCFIPPSTL
ncbi:MAG: helix-turn-helix transcriptional regulator, partial [Nitrospirae bacterium]|nr:helix-turn-helix transcriptional regulator [Nitrospirota bacterium]